MYLVNKIKKVFILIMLLACNGEINMLLNIYFEYLPKQILILKVLGNK